MRTARRRVSPIRTLPAQAIGKRKPFCKRHVAPATLERPRRKSRTRTFWSIIKTSLKFRLR